jgi:class 3 adenylate cyclase
MDDDGWDPEELAAEVFAHLQEALPHADPDWLRARAEAASFQLDQPVVVLSADIRRSTVLMKEAVYPARYAATLSAFIGAAFALVREAGGWITSFTGDGFLGVWLVDDEDPIEDRLIIAAGAALGVARDLVNLFSDEALPSFRRNSRNLPTGVGLSIGIDGGPAQLAFIADTLAVVGTPLVGAVRMVSCAQPGEVLVNNWLGEWMVRERSERDPFAGVASVDRTQRATKEYDAQEVYVVTYDTPDEDGSDALSASAASTADTVRRDAVP